MQAIGLSGTYRHVNLGFVFVVVTVYSQVEFCDKHSSFPTLCFLPLIHGVWFSFA